MQQYLHQLLTLFIAGATRPLHFFPESSLAAAKAKPDKQQKDAQQKWYGNYWIRGERENPAYQLVFDTESNDLNQHPLVILFNKRRYASLTGVLMTEPSDFDSNLSAPLPFLNGTHERVDPWHPKPDFIVAHEKSDRPF